MTYSSIYLKIRALLQKVKPNKYQFIVSLALIFIFAGAYWKFAIPTHRILVKSELIMLGDMDNNHSWTSHDSILFNSVIRNPFSHSPRDVLKVDLNKNGFIDNEDLGIFKALLEADGDPYLVNESAKKRLQFVPRPRELYKFISDVSYIQRPLYALSHDSSQRHFSDWVDSLPNPISASTYSMSLDAEIYNEAMRLDKAWLIRESELDSIERDYMSKKISQMNLFYHNGRKYELLLSLIELVEDAETLTNKRQPKSLIQLLALRDDLRQILLSNNFQQFSRNKVHYQAILDSISRYISLNLGITYDLEHLSPPRNLTSLQNYVDRSEWQYYKLSTNEDDFKKLISFAQNDFRYLRSAARTTKRMTDSLVQNHNLPMILLFREAMHITGNDKRKAIGLLDECIRIPFAWIKGIPKKNLPGSLALNNFLLPGNMEDGSDKSRHWNVFGGVSIYKSERVALDLALKREMKDARENDFSTDAMREFLRDMIANLNGMYHVMAVNQNLIYRN